MSSTNLNNKILICSVAGLCAVGISAYWLHNNSKMKSHVGCEEHMKMIVRKEVMIDILEDLRIELTPHYIHFYNILNELEDEYKEPKSAVLHTLRQKIRKELEEK